jgi:tRNA(Ile)-lysidine synthase
MKAQAPATDTITRFTATVRNCLERLGGQGRGVVAVSGGADSVALLRALAESTPGDLVVAHLNHLLRGEESDADADFVQSLYPSLPHRVESIDVVSFAKSDGDNLEAAARRIRYEFLTRVARETHASWVATAHTMDDQAETILHRLIRGSGLRGLRGIAAKRKLSPGIQLLRPLLTVSRAQVIEFLQESGQQWREDKSNQDQRFTRNRIRHELLPLLRQFNPAIAETLARAAEQAEEVFTEIEEQSQRDLAMAERPKAGGVVILNRAALADFAGHRLRELFHAIWQREGWPLGDMTREHWQRAADVALGRAPSWDLPGRIRIVGTPHFVRLGPSSEVQ